MTALVPTIVNLSAPDPVELAPFYSQILGRPLVTEEPGWAVVRDPAGGVGLAFQAEEHYQRPTWPATPTNQHMMMHLEIRVDDLDGSVAHTLAGGATLAGHQPQNDVRVCLDPVGHPFCLWLGE